MPQYVVNKLMQKQGGVELVKIAKNYERIKPLYQARIQEKWEETYKEVDAWYKHANQPQKEESKEVEAKEEEAKESDAAPVEGGEEQKTE